MGAAVVTVAMTVTAAVAGCGGGGQTAQSAQSAQSAQPAASVTSAESERTTAPSPAGAAAANGAPAPAKIEEVTETHFGKTVRDPYRWMERGGPAFEAFIAEQDAYARRTLAAIPGREALREVLRGANRATTGIEIETLRGSLTSPRIFLWKQAPDQDVALAYVRDGWTGADRLLIDPRSRDRGDVHHTLAYFSPSPDGKHVAYGISASGSEDSVIEILETDSGKVRPEKIDRAQYADLSWRDARSFFYWRRRAPAPGDTKADWFLYSGTYLHVLGDDPEQAQPVFSTTMKELGLAPECYSGVSASPRSKWALASANPGTSADTSYFVAPLAEVVPGKTRWRRISGPGDGVMSMAAHGDTLYAFSYAGASRYRMLAIDARKGTLATAKIFAPERDAVLEDFVTADDAVYLQYFDGGKARLERISYDGERRRALALPSEGTVTIAGEYARPGVRVSLESATSRARDFGYEPRTGFRDLKTREPWPVDHSHLTSEVVEATSADGTKVPMLIVRRADHPLDGSAPALLYGYQAYGYTEKPGFDPVSLRWVDRGGVLATCYGRGNGNRGKQWHLDGVKRNKERGVEDFLACASYLIDRKLTAATRLTAMGTSAGGILVGGAITRRPELFTAAILQVPMANVLRFEQTEGSHANAPELGSVSDAGDFVSLLATDPYHRLVDGAKLPAMLITGGGHDVRVPLWQQAKFAARAQAASGSGRPILLRVEQEGGHFATTSTQAEDKLADLYAFALWQSNVAISAAPEVSK